MSVKIHYNIIRCPSQELEKIECPYCGHIVEYCNPAYLILEGQSHRRICTECQTEFTFTFGDK